MFLPCARILAWGGSKAEFRKLGHGVANAWKETNPEEIKLVSCRDVRMHEDALKKISLGVWNFPQLPRFHLEKLRRCVLPDHSVIFEFEVSINDLVESDMIDHALIGGSSGPYAS